MTAWRTASQQRWVWFWSKLLFTFSMSALCQQNSRLISCVQEKPGMLGGLLRRSPKPGHVRRPSQVRQVLCACVRACAWPCVALRVRALKGSAGGDETSKQWCGGFLLTDVKLCCAGSSSGRLHRERRQPEWKPLDQSESQHCQLFTWGRNWNVPSC